MVILYISIFFFSLCYSYLYVDQLLLFAWFHHPQLILRSCSISTFVPAPPLLSCSSKGCTSHQYTISDRGYGKVIAHWWVRGSLSPAALHRSRLHIPGCAGAPEQPCFPVGSLKPQAQSGLPACRIHNVRHLHIPSNHHINLGPCAGL